MKNPYRALPSIDRLLAQPEIREFDGLPQSVLAELAREIVMWARDAIGSGGPAADIRDLTARLVVAARDLRRPSLQRVINATGVIIHTNLGRAPLSDEALAAMEHVSRGYSNLEFDLAQGERGSRFTHLEELLRRVTGADAGIAVNNNASALLLTLSTFCPGREVIISRSQAVEIGGGFRIPDVMRQSGARLVEVGTTNRTYLRDFEDAAAPETAAFLRVHASNFRIIGFTTFPSLDDLASAAHRHDALLIDDLGSGCLLPVEPFGLAHEPTVQESVTAGADLSLFSGDKLLGGPQAGIIVGRAALIGRLRAHPLARAVRLDKTSIAGLAITLLHFLRGEALEKVPVWRMISASPASLEERATAWAARLGSGASVVAGRSMIGGGSLPQESLPTSLLAITAASATAVAARLRAGSPAVVARTEGGRVLIDPRTVDPWEDAELVSAIGRSIAGS